MQRTLTGIQPSGQIHIGNYLGAYLPALELQKQHQAFFFIADFHALTSVSDPQVLRDASRETAATFLALEMDLERTTIFRQSAVPEVCELAWILSCQVSSGLLDRGHSVKAAKDGGRDINAGVVFYPLLMAADILLYDAHIVPVGQDQKQHLEITRDIAVKMNHHYGEGTLVVPEIAIKEDVGLVPGVDGRKMSKSYGNTLPVWDPPKKLRRKIMRIVTDSKGVDDIKDPDSCNVFQLYKLFATPDEQAALRARYLSPGMGYGHAKQELFDVMDRSLAAPRERFNSLMEQPDELDQILEEGARRARQAALKTMERVRSAVGLT